MDTALASIHNVLAIRLCRGEDLMGSIRAACEQYHINAGCIISVVGSVQEAVFFDPRPDPRDPAGISYGDPIYVPYPAEVISAHGEINLLENGERSIHIHAAFADSQGNVKAGHLMSEGNKALNTVNIIIALLDDVEFGVKYDPVLQAPCFCPRQK